MKSQMLKSLATGCTQPEAHIEKTLPLNHTPIYPAVDSLHGRLLARLLSYREITLHIHLHECGSSALPGAVFKLRHTYHWSVTMEMRQVSNRDKINDTSKIGFYTLPVDIIAQADVGGKSYVEQVAALERKAQGGAA
jgi:hypothetical protein